MRCPRLPAACSCLSFSSRSDWNCVRILVIVVVFGGDDETRKGLSAESKDGRELNKP